MVTFNFSNVASAVQGSAFFPLVPGGGGIVTAGDNPIQFTSALTGQGLPDNTMQFTVSTSSSTYGMLLDDGNDLLKLDVSGLFSTGTNIATFTMTFDAGSGLNLLSDVSLATSLVGPGAVIEFRTTGGGFTDTSFTGEIDAIRFTLSFSSLRILSLTGTPTCFAAGTRIATPLGSRDVQHLAIGETILTHDGGTREVLWIGRQSFDTTFGVPDHLRPVRISAGALGDGLPMRDLVVTADHAMLIDGFLLVNASALVNGDTICFDTPDQTGKELNVYHIETEDHAVILAEGCPAETYVDVAARANFDNYAEYVALYGTERIIPESPLPRITSERLLPVDVKARLGKSPASQRDAADKSARAA